MNNNKLHVLFVLDKINTNSKRLAPLRCRLTYKSERKVFSTSIFINPNNWFSKQQMLKPLNTENTQINTQLSLIKQKINQAFLFLQLLEEEFDVEDIYNYYRGDPINKKLTGVIEFYNDYLDKLKKLISKDFKFKTYRKFEEILNDVRQFILIKYKKKELSLSKLDYNFIENFEFYLKTERKNAQVTVNKKVQRLKKVLKEARKQKLIDFNPFEDYKSKQAKTKIIFLTQEELNSLKRKNFHSETLNKVKDCYIFCCYTGLGYSEMFSLKKTDLKKDEDGTLWIYKEREKTDRAFSIPLIFNETLDIIEKYKNNGEFLLPRISNQYFNRVLKKIAFILGIEKRLTHHIARKTFATTVLLNNNIPIETVSKLLGHSKITTTLTYYAEVMPSKLKHDLEGLRNRLEK